MLPVIQFLVGMFVEVRPWGIAFVIAWALLTTWLGIERGRRIWRANGREAPLAMRLKALATALPLSLAVSAAGYFAGRGVAIAATAIF